VDLQKKWPQPQKRKGKYGSKKRKRKMCLAGSTSAHVSRSKKKKKLGYEKKKRIKRISEQKNPYIKKETCKKHVEGGKRFESKINALAKEKRNCNGPRKGGLAQGGETAKNERKNGGGGKSAHEGTSGGQQEKTKQTRPERGNDTPNTNQGGVEGHCHKSNAQPHTTKHSRTQQKQRKDVRRRESNKKKEEGEEVKTMKEIQSNENGMRSPKK